MPETPGHTVPDIASDPVPIRGLRSALPLHRRPRLIGILAMLVLALGIIGVRFWLLTRDHETTRSAVVQNDGGGLSVLAFFAETQASRIRPGQPARIRIAGTRETLRGHVDSLAETPGEDPPTYRRVPVKITLDTPPPPNTPLHAGTAITVRVTTR